MRSRIEKLRAMAEHPTSNVHEAELARKEIERLKASGVTEERPLSWLDVGRSRNMEEFGARYHEMLRRDREAEAARWTEYRNAMDRFRLEFRKRPIDWANEDPGPHTNSPPRAVVAAWVASLRPGDVVRVKHSVSWLIYDGAPLTQRTVTVERHTTGGQVVMVDGERFNKNGYKVGETGSNGLRTFIAPLVEWPLTPPGTRG